MTKRLHDTKNYLGLCLGVMVALLGFSLSLSAQIQITFTTEEPTCFGLPNGSVTALPSNGVPPYTYLWNTGATSQVLSGVTSGTYSVTVTDATSVTASNSIFLSQPSRVTATLTVDQNCSAPFDITANPGGGVGPYTYNWSTGATTQSIFNVPDGQYCVTVVDSRLCGIPECITVTTSSPSVNVQANNVTCPGGNDGNLTAFPSGGQPPYLYQWSNGGTTQTITNLTAGTYTVTLTDANGCTAVGAGTVAQPPPLSVNVSVNQPDCQGDNDGNITVVPSGGTPGYSYLWNTGATTPSIFNLAPGTYTVTITDANACPIVRQIPITPRSNLTVGAVGTPETCPGFNNGFATANPLNGVMPYIYQWNTGGTQQVIENLTPGSYTVTVTDAAGCVGVATAIVEAATPLIVVTSGANPTTCGVSNGSATANVTSGSGPFTYLWNTGATTQTITGLGAGTYTVTVTDMNGCSTSASTTLVAPPDVFVDATATPLLCPGSTNGQATANVTAGTPPYSYVWSTGAVSQSIFNLVPGTYSVTVTDANGCRDIDAVTISQAPGVTINLTGTEIVCGIGNTGSATAIPTSGTAPFSYSWSNGATTQTITGVPEGIYTVTVTDANGCSAVRSITIDVIELIVVAVGTNPNTCGVNNGSATANVTVGIGPFTYFWNTGATTQTITGLGAGTYTVTITDTNGCTASASTTLVAPPDVFVDATATPLLCTGDTNGQATANATAGTPPYSYTWSNGATGQSIFNLAPGTYTVTVTDANGCTDTDVVTISQAPAVNINISGTEIVCGAGNTGTATATPISGTAPFSYNWSNGATTQTITGVPEGIYTVTVTDANGCFAVRSININIIDDLAVNLIPRPVLCFGGNTGSILAQVTGGNEPYTYTWSNNAGNISELLNLVAGFYAVTVTDANGCTTTGSTTITQPDNLLVNVNGTDPGCPGEATGSAMVTATGGTPPYQYAWSNGAVGQNLTGLAAGSYTVTVTDGNLCTTQANITLTDPPALNVNVSAPTISCGGTSTGSAIAIASGGNGPYTYQWSDGQTTPTAVNLIAGTYQLTVTDANGCTQTVPTIILDELPALNIDFNITNIECTDAPIGVISAIATNGTPPYSFSWSNGQMTQTISNLPAGTYTVTVTDANGCSAVREATVQQTAGFTVGAPGTNITCFGDNDGAATVIPNGGQAPFSYIWSNDETTQSISNLGPGIYAVTVTDANECLATASVVISEPTELLVNVTGVDVDCGDMLDGTAVANVSGGTAPYTYLWSTGAVTSSLSNLGSGTYIVTVTDANGCTAVGSRTITAPTTLTVNITQNSGTCTNANQGILVANVFGGTAPFQYNWSNGANTSTISNLPGGTYSVTVTDANGCTQTATAGLTVFPAPTCVVNVDQVADLGDNGQLTVNVSSGTAPFTYDWSNGDDTQTITNLSAGVYTVTVTDANGCETVCSATLDLLAGIGDYVWEDIDHDGQQDADEPPIPGITVNLKDINNNVIATTTTDMNGEYFFLGLDPGTYSVQFVIPDGLDYTRSNTGDDATDSDIVPDMEGMTDTYVLDPGELDFTVDAGLFVPPFGELIDPCTCLNNSTTEDNGQFDELYRVTSYPGETWTIISGSGLFERNSPNPPAAPIPATFPQTLPEIAPGIYTLNFRVVDEIPYSAVVTNGFSTLSITNLCEYPTVNIMPPPPIELCITDPAVPLSAMPTEPGALIFTINGAVVNTVDPAALGIGTYELVTTFTPDDPTECEATIISTIDINDDCVAKLGDYVWEDIDHDGQQDPDEPAIPNVTVNLKDANGNVIDQTTTDVNGFYCFTPLDAGTYSVQFVIPDGLDYTRSNTGDDATDSDIIPNMNGMTGTVTLEEGDENLTLDGGLYVPPEGELTDPCTCLNNATTEDNGQFSELFTVRSYPDEIWTVISGDGKFFVPNGEPPAPPVLVTLPMDMVEVAPGVYEFAFRLVDEIPFDIVATNGFDTLSISNVCVYPTLNLEEVPPFELCLADDPVQLAANPNMPGNVVFTVNGEVTTVVDPLELGVGNYELISLLIPFDPEECEARVVTQFIVTEDCLATVGDKVWLDVNCDGIQGGNEPGVGGIEVTITGTAEFLEPNVMETTFTDENGMFQFNVPPGNYKLTFGQVPGFELTAPNQGNNDEVDSDVDPVTFMTEIFHLDPDEVNLSFDMGLCPECININYPGAIGFDQFLCAPGNDPDPFVSLAEPTGGSGPIEYLWMSTAGSPNTPIQTWQPIPNSNSPTYDPGPIFQTTYFARCARVVECGPFLESNILEVTVGSEAGGDIASPGIACWNEPVTFEAVNLINGGSVRWNFGPNATPSTATGRTATTTFTTVGNFQVEMIVTAGDCDAFIYDQITISTLPTVCSQGLILGSTVTDNATGGVMLDWEMSAAFEPFEYVVEYSDDGVDFKVIDQVTEESRLLNGIRYYEYATVTPKKGLNYYRVSITDSMGNSVASNVEEVIIFTESKIAMLYPNPVTDQLTIEIFETFDADDVSLEVYAVSGQRMAVVKVDENSKNVQLDMSPYPAGAYLVQLLLGETNIRTMKVIKR